MMKLCRNCYTENPLEAALCSECGMSLIRAPTGEEAMKLKNEFEAQRRRREEGTTQLQQRPSTSDIEEERIYPQLRVIARDRAVAARVFGGFVLVIGVVGLLTGVMLHSLLFLEGEGVPCAAVCFSFPLIIIAGILIYFGAYLFGWQVPLTEWISIPVHRNVWRRSQATSQAEILDLRVETHVGEYGEHHTYWVTFRFDTAEGQVTLRAKVSQPYYRRLEAGTTVSVRYAAENPRVA